MSSIHVTACQPRIYITNISRCCRPSKDAFPINTGPLSRISLSPGKPSSGLQCVPFSKSRQPLHVCFAGEKGMMGNNSEDSPWKALEKAMEKFKGQSVEDVLRQQIQKGEYLDDGGSGAKPPGGGGGGGDGGGAGGSEEESFGEMLDETLQAVLATLGFIFMYIYILTGEELAKLARDYIRYLFTGKQSVRLKRAMSQWGQYYLAITEKQAVDKYCLEKAILNTPTWWNDPDDYREVVLNYLESNSDE
ncbi:uncharacterized protein LOC114714939 [Neltuma alba]|uniref:uncharacterized protein LOC114714939 n=1 Tax=Neltuma alba TaxID=207710 RepID=UPI0010A48B48|nr:uncharacterized protein LOC114714939 [Prosopis alba]XP_028755562.1 uncharacterized protein LOC114714939 [Prosopis alba]XP_028755563.1 uncharacterized protein LOC114714939 [Prosopis alba]XP_028755564.1 uncharacterized protein LOC114714939 [Prosopis alba]